MTTDGGTRTRLSVRPLCRCHRSPMYPNNSVGGWRCAIKTRARQRAADRAYWHRTDGGYVRARRRALAAQRADVLERLAQLNEEAALVVA